MNEGRRNGANDKAPTIRIATVNHIVLRDGLNPPLIGEPCCNPLESGTDDL